MDKIIKDFKWMYAIVFLVAGGLVYMAVWAPRGYQIVDFSVIVPVGNQLVCHFLLPITLGLF
jgi:hypothetical protein